MYVHVYTQYIHACGRAAAGLAGYMLLSTHPGGKVGSYGRTELVAILSAGLLAQLAEHWGTNPRSLFQAW